jgi:hypothetical protein
VVLDCLLDFDFERVSDLLESLHAHAAVERPLVSLDLLLRNAKLVS